MKTMFNAVILADSLLALWFDDNSRKVHFKSLQGKPVESNWASPRGLCEVPQGLPGVEGGGRGPVHISLCSRAIAL